MKLLVLSNGHGEDLIAVRIIKQLQTVTKKLELVALPIVGEGYAYQKSNIAIAGRVQQMPSGGFIYMGGNPLWQDLRSGLIALTIEQIKLVRQWGKEGGSILAVGDIVPLFYAWLSGSKYAFVGTAKSEYYLRDETGWLKKTSPLEKSLGSVYLPWERWLMSSKACKGVFPRDSLTSSILQRHGIPAYDLGNPMMDEIMGEIELKESSNLKILILAGSRMPEALRNWRQILICASQIIKDNQQPEFLGAIAPALEVKPFINAAVEQGWQLTLGQSATYTFHQDNASLILSQSSYVQFLQEAKIAIAMAGTATEEFVGLGKPVVIMPGEGPQFTYAFAEAQSRLLGSSISMVENTQQVSHAISELVNNPQKLKQIALNGKRRMGKPGASLRIAECLVKQLGQ